MENIVCFSVLVDNNEGPSIQLGMRALPLYYRNSFSDRPFVVRARRHMTRVVLDVPMKRKYPVHQVVGLGVVLYVLSFLVGCTPHQKLIYME